MKNMPYILYIILIISCTNYALSQKVIKPLMRINEFEERRHLNDFNSVQNRINAINSSKKSEILNKNNPEYLLSQQPMWEQVGPSKIGGRVRSIAWHPKNENIIYIGAAAGGVWKTTDKGNSWKPIFDYENSISIGAIAIDNNLPNILYVGTGEMIIGGGIPYLGSGMYKSTDDGNTWKLIGLSEVGSFSKVYVHPKNSNIIVAGGATFSGGLYISSDAGANFNKFFEGNITDVSINPDNINEIVIGVDHQGIFYTNDLGQTWEQRNKGIDNFGRISIQGYKRDFSKWATLIEKTNSYAQIYISTDKGKNWNLCLDDLSNFFRFQGFYNNVIEINPNNSNYIFAGGINLWRYKNQCFDWESQETKTEGGMHVDQHCISFNPSNTNELIVGNDGGVYLTTNLGETWKSINNNLFITQFYAIGLDYTDNYTQYGGTQDNGSLFVNQHNYKKIMDGDGFDIFVHPKDNNSIFGELYFGKPFKYDKNNNNFKYITNGISSQDSGLWHSPLILDRKSETMYLGLSSIYASVNYGEIWFKLTKKYEYKFTSIAVSEANSRIIYAGNVRGEIIISTNQGSTWNQINAFNLPGRYVTEIKTSKTNENVSYVTFGGFDVPNVFKTTDKGKTWLEISQDLPNIHINCLDINPLNEDIIVAGTDIGVFITYNAGKNWFPLGRNLPRSPVTDLAFHRNYLKNPGIVLRAATHGRSIWEIVVPTEVVNTYDITSPAGGEYLYGNNFLNLSWYGFTLPVKIEFSVDGKTNWTTVANDVNNNFYLWQIPNIYALKAKIKITSLTDNLSIESNSFTIGERKIGIALKVKSVPFIPYGIAYNGKGQLWVTDYNINKLRQIDANNLNIIKEVYFKDTGNYTDIYYDKTKDLIYLIKLNPETIMNSYILVCDTNGNIISKIHSPASYYPTGLTSDDYNLYVSERDGSKYIYVIDPTKPDKYIKRYVNPILSNYGPRCLTYNDNKFHQIETNFFEGFLKTTKIIVYEIKNESPHKIIREIPLLYNNYINARGIEYDEKDKNYWITDYDGNIYKVFADDATVSIENQIEEDFSVFPNPARDYIKINNNQNIADINIYNIYSQKVLDITSNDKLIQIDISEFPAGTYFIKYKSVNKVSMQKFIKID